MNPLTNSFEPSELAPNWATLLPALFLALCVYFMWPDLVRVGRLIRLEWRALFAVSEAEELSKHMHG